MSLKIPTIIPDGSAAGTTLIPDGSAAGTTLIHDGSAAGTTLIPDGSTAGITPIHIGPPPEDSAYDPFNLKITELFSNKLNKENYIDNINIFLKKIGIKSKIEELSSRFTSKFTNDLHKHFPQINKLSDDTYETFLNKKKIIFKKESIIDSGTHNIVSYISTNSYVHKEAVLREINTEKEITYENITDFMYENLKHIILYIINRCNIGKEYQIVPQPLLLGYYEENSKIIPIFIMEKADITLGNIVKSKITDIFKEINVLDNKLYIKKLIYTFYKGLSLLNDNLDYFIHGDSKFNNCMIKNDKIILIDFGFSSFKLFDLIFNSEASFSLYNSFEFKRFNPVQDLLQMLFSFYQIIFELSESTELSEIVEDRTPNIIFSIFNDIFYISSNNFVGYNVFVPNMIRTLEGERIELKSFWRIFYKANYLTVFFYDGINIYITPEEMKYDYQIDINKDSELFNDFYYKKYLKYKNKYLSIKNNF